MFPCHRPSHSLTIIPRMEFDFDAVNEEDSPFPEVRASVSNIDDPEMPVMTLRMWVIGLILSLIGGLVHSLSIYFNRFLIFADH